MSTTFSKFEGKFRDETLPNFMKAIQSMETFVTLALRMGTAVLSDSECSEIMKVIAVANKQTEEAEQQVLDIVKSLNEDFEKSTVEISRMRAEKQRLEESVSATKKQLESAEHQRDLERQHLQKAETDLSEAEAILRREKQKQQEAKTVRDVGGGLMFIPFIGWIIGGIMIGVGEEELTNATATVESANNNCASQRSILKESERQLQSYIQQMDDKKKEKKKVKHRLAEQQDLDRKRDLYTKLADVLDVVKRCAQYLCSIHGKVALLRDQSEHLYCMEPLIMIIEDMVSSVEKLPTAMLLLDSSEAFAKSIANLKEKCSQMKAICSK